MGWIKGFCLYIDIELVVYVFFFKVDKDIASVMYLYRDIALISYMFFFKVGINIALDVKR